MSMSLINLLKNDDDFQRRLAARVNEVKEDKGKISSFAESYSEKYKTEIEEGDKLRQNLLTEGSSNGLSEEQIFSGRGFIPMKSTPILNMLYFMLSESANDPYYGAELQHKRDKINEYLKSTYKTEDDINENDSELLTAVSELYNDTKSHSFREQFNNDINIEHHQTPAIDMPEETKDPEDISEYLYGHATLENFSVVKKLKKLATNNSNKEEAFLAFTKCHELCTKFGLDFDRIPSR